MFMCDVLLLLFCILLIIFCRWFWRRIYTSVRSRSSRFLAARAEVLVCGFCIGKIVVCMLGIVWVEVSVCWWCFWWVFCGGWIWWWWCWLCFVWVWVFWWEGLCCFVLCVCVCGMLNMIWVMWMCVWGLWCVRVCGVCVWWGWRCAGYWGAGRRVARDASATTSCREWIVFMSVFMKFVN